MMFAFGFAGPWELIIIAGIVLLLFGNRLPSVMRSMGRGIVEFKRGISEGDEPDSADKQIDDGAKTPEGTA